MTDTTYTFTIDDFTPDTMPFGRLVEYYEQLGRLLGEDAEPHLVALTEGSHNSTLRIGARQAPALMARLAGINSDTAPASARNARDSIDDMLRKDGTSGSLCNDAGTVVIPFTAGKVVRRSDLQIRGPASLSGELYHIAGAPDGGANVRISTAAYGRVLCTTSRELARAMRDRLFDQVRVTGKGNWSRGADGNWSIRDFVITDYDPVTPESLREAVKRLHEMPVDWPDDPLARIAEIEERHGSGR